MQREKCKEEFMLIRLTHMKKLIRIFLLAALFLAACVAQNTTVQETATATEITQTATPTSSPTPTSTPSTSSEQQLTFWHPWTGTKAASVAALIEEYNAINQGGITINAIAAGDDDYLISEINAAIENNSVPDLVVAPADYLRSQYDAQGILIGLDDFVNDPEKGISEDEQKTIPAAFWNGDVINGERYGVPAEYTLHFLYYNQTWAQELGFETAPTSSEEFLNQACAAARYNANDGDADNNGTGGWIYNTDAVTMLSWMQVFGGGEIPPETQRGFSFNTSENQRALEFLRTIYQLDCAWSGKEETPYRYFSKRYALFYSGSTADWNRQITMDETENNTDEWTIIAYPGNDGNPIVNGEALSYGIFKTNSEKEQAAWDFIHWMISNEVQERLSEETFSIPINLAVVQDMSDFLGDNSKWQRVLTYLPLSKPTPLSGSWSLIKNLLQDMGWQLSLYTVKEADIPAILENLENMANEGINGS